MNALADKVHKHEVPIACMHAHSDNMANALYNIANADYSTTISQHKYSSGTPVIIIGAKFTAIM